MLTLHEIFQSHTGPLVHKWDHYLEIYDRYFSSYRGTAVNFLEIGISHGGSLEMWRKYFGDQANIFAVDINPGCKQFESGKTKIFIGSQEDPAFLSSLKAQLPQLDLVIDDGGHTMNQQIVTFNQLFSSVKDGGIFMVEDTHTSYWREYHGGYKNKNSFVEFSKNMIDQLYAWHIDNDKIIPVNYITENVRCISFYDSVVVFEKKARKEPSHTMKGVATITPYEDPTLRRDSVIDKIRKKIFGGKGLNSFNRQLKKS